MFIPYSGYFSWGKIFAELRHNVLQNADFFAEANFRNSFIDIHKVQSKLAVVYAHNGETLICQIVVHMQGQIQRLKKGGHAYRVGVGAAHAA